MPAVLSQSTVVLCDLLNGFSPDATPAIFYFPRGSPLLRGLKCSACGKGTMERTKWPQIKCAWLTVAQ